MSRYAHCTQQQLISRVEQLETTIRSVAAAPNELERKARIEMALAEFVDVREHVKSLMQSNGKLTYKDLFSVLVYTEGKTAWLNQQVREQEAQRAKQELVLARQELAGQPPEVNELSSLDNKDDGNTLTDHEPRKGWRKVIVETKRDAPDE